MRIYLWCLSLFAAGLAWAHDDATLDGMAAPHGGQLRMAGPWHLELVLDSTPGELAERAVQVHLSDHAGTPLPERGLSAHMTLLSAGSVSRVVLTPAGPSLLAGRAVYRYGADLKAVIALRDAEGQLVQARFTPASRHLPGEAGAHSPGRGSDAAPASPIDALGHTGH